MGWLDHMVTLFLFLRVLHTVLHSGYTSLHSHQQSLYTFLFIRVKVVFYIDTYILLTSFQIFI